MSSSFVPSPAELALVQKIFAQPDAQKLGALTGEIAVQIFAGSKLSPAVLGEIWTISDKENNGWLSKKGAAVAVRLMGWAQKGERVTEELINKPGPLPTIEGITDSILPQTTGTSGPKSPSFGAPSLTPQDKSKFMKLFAGAGPVHGLLSGDKARDILVKSKLPVDKLSQIWSLADTQNRGALDSTDFTIAMYLVQACMSGQLSFIPTSLPPGLYEQAGGRQPESVASHSTGGSAGSFSPSLNGSFPGRSSAIQTPVRTHMTGSALKSSTGPPLPSRPSPAAIGGSAFGTAVQFHSTGQAPKWDITPSEKATSDAFFDTLDTERKGYIEGDIAVPFMLQSQLPEEALAQVWDLSDISNDGRLTRDGFAVAMHLIQSKLAGKELPSVLPTSLIPPSMRANAPFAAPPRSPPPHEPLRDLLWDDTPASATSQPTIFPQRTGPLSPQHTAVPTAFSPPALSVPQSDPFATMHRDLLGDDDEPAARSPPLEDKSAEIGNTQNQLNSTNRSLEAAKGERNSVERTLVDQAAQLSALQTQLASSKAAYETENNLLATLRERYAVQSSEIQKTKQELIRAESDLSALRVEKAEIEGSLLRDKEEVRDLHRKMHEVGVQMEGIKAEVEKTKKEAKQQKGLLAIAKKQLLTREHEKEKTGKELEEAQNEVKQMIQEREETEAMVAKEVVTETASPAGAISPGIPDNIFATAVAQPLPMSPLVTGNGTSATSPKSNNPFDRLMSSAASSPRSQSPFLPFTNAPIPTPPAVSAADTSVLTDPFGLETSEADKFAADPPAMSNGVNNDVANGHASSDIRPHPILSTSPPPANGLPEDNIASPDAEFWHTPPQTATSAFTQQIVPGDELKAGQQDEGTLPAAALEALDVSANENGDETDIGTQLKEIEPVESDSSDDEEPLGKRRESLIAKNTDGAPEAELVQSPSDASVTQPLMPSFDDAFGEVASLSTPASPVPGAISQMRSSSPAWSTASASKDAFDVPSAPQEPPVDAPSSIEAVLESNAAASTMVGSAGISDFDEALGKLPSKSPDTAAAPFSFDTAFDDNFDFAKASAETSAPFKTDDLTHSNGFDAVFMSPGTEVANGGPSITSGPKEPPPVSFDDTFGVGASTDQSSKVQSQAPISFDDAFGGGGVENNEASSFDKTFGTASSRGSTSSQPQSKAPFPTSSPPLSPFRGPSSQVSERNVTSPPPRSVSPPIRHASPKPRSSTIGSSKDSNEKQKDGPTRHSRLSIRLPFGKKKAKHEPVPPIPSQLSTSNLTPPTEEPLSSQTPAVEDDVESVKQLCGMGFSRSQAVVALEKHGYDVQKALNSLLGSP